MQMVILQEKKSGINKDIWKWKRFPLSQQNAEIKRQLFTLMWYSNRQEASMICEGYLAKLQNI